MLKFKRKFRRLKVKSSAQLYICGCTINESFVSMISFSAVLVQLLLCAEYRQCHTKSDHKVRTSDTTRLKRQGIIVPVLAVKACEAVGLQLHSFLTSPLSSSSFAVE